MNEAMRTEVGEDVRVGSVETISESELKRICDELYRDRFEIYDFNPNATRRDAVLWMLLGCLISLLNITDAELESIDSSVQDLYGESIRKLLRGRTAPPFDPRPVVEELAERVENE